MTLAAALRRVLLPDEEQFTSTGHAIVGQCTVVRPLTPYESGTSRIDARSGAYLAIADARWGGFSR